jgi:hypothetical protein
MEPELNARNLALFVVESVVLFGAWGRRPRHDVHVALVARAGGQL